MRQMKFSGCPYQIPVHFILLKIFHLKKKKLEQNLFNYYHGLDPVELTSFTKSPVTQSMEKLVWNTIRLY